VLVLLRCGNSFGCLRVNSGYLHIYAVWHCVLWLRCCSGSRLLQVGYSVSLSL
jgi:hypothetical protein